MRKFKALFINELVKATRKPLYIILVILISASMIVVGGFIGLLKSLDGSTLSGLWEKERDSEEVVRANIESYKKELEKPLDLLETSLAPYYDSETETFPESMIDAFYGKDTEIFENSRSVEFVLISLYEAENDLAVIELEKKLGRKVDTGKVDNAYDYMFGDMLNAIVYRDARTAYLNDKESCFEKYPAVRAANAQFTLYTWIGMGGESVDDATYAKYLELCIANDVNQVFDYQSDLVRADKDLTDREKEFKLNSLDIMRDLYREDMTYDAWLEIENNFNRLSSFRATLESGKNEQGQNLTKSEIEEYSLIVAEIEQGLRVGAPGYGGKYTTQDKGTGNIIIRIGIGLGQILIVLMGALIVAEDFQSGAIKTLIIAPVKRRRIVSAKLTLLSAATLAVALQVFVTYIIAAFLSSSDFGNNVFVVGNNVISMNPFLYYLFYILVSFLPVYFSGCFAFMISTLVRNAGGSIAISMGSVLLVSESSMVASIIGLFGSQVFFLNHINKFLPASNTGIADALFKSVAMSSGYNIFDLLGGNYLTDNVNSPLFSFIYLAVFSAVFIFISYQSYVKRDVK